MDKIELVRQLYKMFSIMRKRGIQKMNTMATRDFVLLDAIIQNGGAMKMNEISAYFNVSKAAVSQVIRQMEAKQWVERVFDESDRRSVYIRVSPTGEAILKSYETYINKKLEIFIQVVGEEDAKTLIRIMNKMQKYEQLEKENEVCGN